MLNYSDIKKAFNKKGGTIKYIEEQLDYNKGGGFRLAIENGTFPIKKVEKLCKLLDITPNDFFEHKSSKKTVGAINKSIVADTISTATYQGENSKETLQQMSELIKTNLLQAQTIDQLSKTNERLTKINTEKDRIIIKLQKK